MNRIDILAQRYLDGVATPAELAELDAALRGDPAAARAFVGHARLDADLRRLRRIATVVPRPAAVWRRWLPWAAAAVLLLAAGLGWWALRPAPAVEAPFLVDGRPLPAGTALSGTVALIGGGEVVLAAGAVAEAAGTAVAPALRLHRGEAACRVAPRHGGEPFTVTTPHGRLRVVGTVFTVTVDADTHLAVREGTVEAVTAAGTVAVTAGSQIRLASVAPPRLFAPVVQTLPTGRATDWNNNSPGSTVRAAGTGPTGAPALRCLLGREAAPWVSAKWDAGLDWRAGTGISLVLRGTGSGARWSLEVFDNAGPRPGVGGRDTYERFVAIITDDSAGWQERRIPFTAFFRRQDVWPGLPDDGFGRDAVHGISLIADRPAAELSVERIGIYTTP